MNSIDREYTRKDFHQMGMLYSNILNSFAFPHYECIIKDNLNKFFGYDVSDKILVSFSFVGYMLAKNNINGIYPNNYYYKAYLFLDIWEKLICKNEPASSYINSNKGHYGNMIRFEIYKSYNDSLKSFRFSERYLQNNLSYAISSISNKNKTIFSNAVLLNRMLCNLTHDRDLNIITLMDNGIKVLENMKLFVEFIKNVIIKDLCKQWDEDHNIYLTINSLDKYNEMER